MSYPALIIHAPILPPCTRHLPLDARERFLAANTADAILQGYQEKHPKAPNGCSFDFPSGTACHPLQGPSSLANLIFALRSDDQPLSPAQQDLMAALLQIRALLVPGSGKSDSFLANEPSLET